MDWEKEVIETLPGATGSLVALRWITGSPWQLILSFLGGCAASRYGAQAVASWLNMNIGLSGFLLGLFGMAVAARMFASINNLNIDLNSIIGGKKR